MDAYSDKSGRHRIAENILSKDESDLADGCRRYLQWLAVKNYSLYTITNRYYSLNFFVYWARENGLEELAMTSPRPVELFARYLRQWTVSRERPVGVRYIYQYLHTVKAMFDYLAENSIIERNPAESIELPKCRCNDSRDVLAHEQVEKILRQPDVTKWVGIRDRTILEVIYSTGIRRRELLGLELGDVDLHSGVLYVRSGKGGKQRMVPIGERALKWLGKYLYEVRPLLLKIGQCKTLFLTYKGKGFTGSGLGNALTPYLRASGYKGCCHVFRHAMATAMLDNGANISSIQEILGHERLSSTQIYTHVATGKLHEIYQRTHPAHIDEESDRGEKTTLTVPLYNWGGQPFTQKSGKKETRPAMSGALGEQVYRLLAVMARRNMSPQTIDQRHRHLRRFVAWCALREIYEPDQVTHALLEHYHKELYRQRHQDKPLNPSYIGRHLISIRRFFAWLSTAGVLPRDVAQKLKLPKKIKSIPHQTLTKEEIERIFAQVDTTGPLGVRDRAILEILWATGMRPQELCNLSIEKVDLNRKTVRIVQENSARERIVPITASAHKWLEIYLSQARQQLQRQNVQALFLGRYGPPISKVTLAERVRIYFRKAGIQKPANCSIFRNTLATVMLENGVDIRHLQQILGHANLTSTQIYTKVSIRRLKEIHLKTHPTAQTGTEKPGKPD